MSEYCRLFEGDGGASAVAFVVDIHPPQALIPTLQLARGEAQWEL